MQLKCSWIEHRTSTVHHGYAAPFGCRAVGRGALSGIAKPAIRNRDAATPAAHLDGRAIPPGGAHARRSLRLLHNYQGQAAPRLNDAFEGAAAVHDEPRDDLALAGPHQGGPRQGAAGRGRPPPDGRGPRALAERLPRVLAVGRAARAAAAADARRGAHARARGVVLHRRRRRAPRPRGGRVGRAAGAQPRRHRRGGAPPPQDGGRRVAGAGGAAAAADDERHRLPAAREPGARGVQQAVPAQPGAHLPRGEQDHAQLARRVGDREGRLPPGGGAGAPPRDPPLRPRPPRPLRHLRRVARPRPRAALRARQGAFGPPPPEPPGRHAPDQTGALPVR